MAKSITVQAASDQRIDRAIAKADGSSVTGGKFTKPKEGFVQAPKKVSADVTPTKPTTTGRGDKSGYAIVPDAPKSGGHLTIATSKSKLKAPV